MPVAPQIPQVNVGLDPGLQQMLVGMMQTQHNMLQLLMKKQEEDERRRKQSEAASAVVAHPFDRGTTGRRPLVVWEAVLLAPALLWGLLEQALTEQRSTCRTCQALTTVL